LTNFTDQHFVEVLAPSLQLQSHHAIFKQAHINKNPLNSSNLIGRSLEMEDLQGLYKYKSDISPKIILPLE